MRMGCLFASGTFWGVLFILLGILLIVKVVFNVNIPVFRILFALLLIYFGIRLLAGGWGGRAPEQAAIFSESRFAPAEGNEYRVVFGKGVIDFTGVSLSSGTVRKNIQTVFGNSTVKLDPQTPVKVDIDASFAAARLPDGSVVSFGRYTYVSRAYREGADCLLIQARVVFGELSILEAPR